MIYLEFLEGQGLGNQLWNYFCIRALSEEIGEDFKIIKPENFKGKDFLSISYHSLDRQFTQKENLNYYSEKLFYDKKLRTYSSYFDVNILNIKSNTLIKGLFQSERYFFGKDINKYIKIKDLNNNNFDAKDKCILNIRGGEYKRHKNLILPKSYWENAIRNILEINNKISFYIVTDDYKYASKLFPKYEILYGNIEDDFMNLHKAKYLIVSNSSFSYFPISLGEKPEMIRAPAHWARFGNSENKWISPANYYQGWNYQDKKGLILSKKDIERSIKNTLFIYSKYNILTSNDAIIKSQLNRFLPLKFRKFIKNILSIIFPMKF